MAFGDLQTSFFVLCPEEYGSQYDAEYEPVRRRRGPGQRCDACGNVVESGEWLPPFRVELTLHGDEFGDFCFGPGRTLEFLVSETFAAAFMDARLSGLSGFEPVELTKLRRARGKHAPAYLHVTVARSAAALDERRSLILPPPGPCRFCRSWPIDAIYGFSVDVSGWRGEDVFRPSGLAAGAVGSQRFRDFVVEHGFTGLRLVPVEEYQWDSLGTIETRDAPAAAPIRIAGGELWVESLHRLPFDRARFLSDLRRVLGSDGVQANEAKLELLEMWRRAWLMTITSRGAPGQPDLGMISFGPGPDHAGNQRPWLLRPLVSDGDERSFGFYVHWQPGHRLWYGDRLLELPAPSPAPSWLWERVPYEAPYLAGIHCPPTLESHPK